MTSTPIRIWGHRGCRGPGDPPENSRAAFRQALQQGAHGIELDVFATLEGELVVFHDEDLARMTGVPGRLTAQRWAALRSLRLRAPDGTATGEGIPTLDEVLDTVAQGAPAPPSGFVVNIETKHPDVLPRLVECLRRRLANGWSPRHFLHSSFNLPLLTGLRAALPMVPQGALFAGPRRQPAAPWDLGPEDLAACLAEARQVAADTINLTLPTLLHPGVAEQVCAAGLTPVAWTCAEVPPDKLPPAAIAQVLALLRRHQAVLITDHPGAWVRLAAAA